MAKARSQPSNGRAPKKPRSVKTSTKGGAARAPRTVAARRVHPIVALAFLRDLEITELADQVPMNRSNIYKYIRRLPKWHMTRPMAKKLADFSGLSEKFFLGHDVMVRVAYR